MKRRLDSFLEMVRVSVPDPHFSRKPGELRLPRDGSGREKFCNCVAGAPRRKETSPLFIEGGKTCSYLPVAASLAGVGTRVRNTSQLHLS